MYTLGNVCIYILLCISYYCTQWRYLVMAPHFQSVARTVSLKKIIHKRELAKKIIKFCYNIYIDFQCIHVTIYIHVDDIKFIS